MIIVLIFAPSIFWIGYSYYHDRLKPEPPILTALAYLLGFFSAWLCLKFYDFLLPFFNIPVDIESFSGFNLPFLLYCVFGVGLVEEVFKFLPFRIMIGFSDFNEKIDGFFYASALALGFASYENIHYLPELSGFALFGRTFASPMTHTIFASIWGYWVGIRRIQGQSLWPAILGGLGLASLAHGLYDFFTVSPYLRLLGALLLLIIWLWRIRTSELLVKKESN